MITEEDKYLALNKDDTSFIQKNLLNWYERNKRDLPWRNTTDPYRIWISEIILQQTRVVQGLGYYLRFIERFPDVKNLAEAAEVEVLKYWQGLGYYSRARNLHHAAQTVMNKFNGLFPTDYKTLLSLKGIGEYTAAAIASISCNQPHPVVDGNVFRFISRLFAVDEPIDSVKGKKEFRKIAGQLLYEPQSGIFNQAIMEFGALQCVPASPDCSKCPFVEKCFAFSGGNVEKYPVKQNKTKTVELYLNYFHIIIGEYTFLSKRQGKGIWQNLYEFPVIESAFPLSFEDLRSGMAFKRLFPAEKDLQFRLKIANKKHILTHRIIYANFYEIVIDKEFESLAPFIKVRTDELDNYPIHRLMELYLK